MLKQYPYRWLLTLREQIRSYYWRAFNRDLSLFVDQLIDERDGLRERIAALERERWHG